jgi:hypothetical protein
MAPYHFLHVKPFVVTTATTTIHKIRITLNALPSVMSMLKESIINLSTTDSILPPHIYYLLSIFENQIRLARR